jgi:hypothetical protein
VFFHPFAVSRSDCPYAASSSIGNARLLEFVFLSTGQPGIGRPIRRSFVELYLNRLGYGSLHFLIQIRKEISLYISAPLHIPEDSVAQL